MKVTLNKSFTCSSVQYNLDEVSTKRFELYVWISHNYCERWLYGEGEMFIHIYSLISSSFMDINACIQKRQMLTVNRKTFLQESILMSSRREMFG